MKFVKHSLYLIFILIFFNFIYSLLISPTLTITNNTDRAIKITKGEFQDFNKDPEMEEVEDMFNNIVLLDPKSSHSYNISSKTLLSKDDIRIYLSYGHGGSLSNPTGESFKISKDGFCRYKMDVYNELHFIETSKINLCYKKLILAE